MALTFSIASSVTANGPTSDAAQLPATYPARRDPTFTPQYGICRRPGLASCFRQPGTSQRSRPLHPSRLPHPGPGPGTDRGLTRM
jgi:hypothetical protein